MDDKTVGNLAEFGVRDRALAGGKGANLGELVRAGFPVPPGFVVTTAGYRTVLAESGLRESLAALVEADAPGSEMRQLFSAARIPGQLREDIAAAYAALGGGPVAVRSSATAEDLPGAAFAGQQDTYLNVAGEDAVMQAVVDCWASLWTERAISYRRRQGIDPAVVAMAVVVQEMVQADTAGVMFSANPVTGERREIVIDAGRGLGEAIISGEVTPDRYVLDPAGRLRSFSPGGSGLAARSPGLEGPEAMAGRTPQPRLELSQEQLAELVRLAVRAQDHFGRPQDVEWAIARGRAYLVQARPITALPPQPFPLNRFQRLVGPFFLEMFQVRPYPLDVSGWMQRGILAMLHGMAGSVGIAFPPLQELLPEEDGVVVRLVPPVPRPTFRTLAAPYSLVRRAKRYSPARWTGDPRFSAFLADVDRLNMQEPGSLPWKAVVTLAEEAFATMRGITELRISYLPGVLLSQLKLRSMLFLLGRRRLAPALIAGAQTRTSQANKALEQLAAQVQSNPDLAGLFTHLNPDELLAALTQRDEFADFHAAFKRFLAEYGHRETMSVVLSSPPTWSEAPEVVLGLVRSMTGQRPPATDQTGEALEDLMRHPAMRIHQLRRRMAAAVESAKAGMAFREDSHFYATMVLPPLRRALLDLGRRLARAGVLARPEDVYHLRFEELDAMVDGDALSAAEKERYRRIVQARAAKRKELEGIPLLEPSALFTTAKGTEGALVSGTPASRGQAKGMVRIIHGPDEFGSLLSGEILVCPYTNPSWTPLFQRAAAVVVDLGGLGSHAAIVAREYGIPAVMGTGSGTRTLTDGQMVVVDGTAGLVSAA